MTTLCHSETHEQEGLVNWFRTKFPTVLIYAIPNGGVRSLSTAKRLKAEGVVAGMPDLHIPQWNLWIEMKRVSGGRVSPDQKRIIAELESIGHAVIIGYGATDASRKVMEWVASRAK